MTDKRLLYKRPGGVEVVHEYDHITNTQTVHEYQDATPFLELAAKERQFDDESFKHGVKNSFWRVGHIPVGLRSKWLKEFCDLTGRRTVPMSDPEFEKYEIHRWKGRDFRKFHFTTKRF